MSRLPKIHPPMPPNWIPNLRRCSARRLLTVKLAPNLNSTPSWPPCLVNRRARTSNRSQIQSLPLNQNKKLPLRPWIPPCLPLAMMTPDLPPPQCKLRRRSASLIQQAQEATKFGGPNSGSPPLLDFKSLLLPISEEEPAGGGVPFDVREQLEQARKEINPEAFAPDDPLRPEDFVKADWKMIIGVTQDTLRGRLEESLDRRPAAGSAGQAIRPDGPSRRATLHAVIVRSLLGPDGSAF